MTRTLHQALGPALLTLLVATPCLAQGPSAAAPAAVPHFNAQDPCRAEVSKFEQAIGYVRQAQGHEAAAAMKEKWLPAKLESELLLSKGYCGIAKHLQDQKWQR